MGTNTKIEWTDHTWNPWIGCTKVSPACDHCYAEAWAKRYGRAQWGDHPRQRTSAANWRAPYKWNKETPGDFVFCASLADIFDNQVDPQWRADAFDVMRATPCLTYLLLTKRPQNIERLASLAGGLPANAAIGCTVVTQDEANRDVPKLLHAGGPHRVRFVSIEPMLGPITLWPTWLTDYETDNNGPVWAGLSWVIVGGESGPNARPMHPDWARSLRDQCAAGGVAFFFKQWGEWVCEEQSPADACFPGEGRDWFNDGKYWAKLGKKAAGRLLDGVEHNERPPLTKDSP